MLEQKQGVMVFRWTMASAESTEEEWKSVFFRPFSVSFYESFYSNPVLRHAIRL